MIFSPGQSANVRNYEYLLGDQLLNKIGGMGKAGKALKRLNFPNDNRLDTPEQ